MPPVPLELELEEALAVDDVVREPPPPLDAVVLDATLLDAVLLDVALLDAALLDVALLEAMLLEVAPEAPAPDDVADRPSPLRAPQAGARQVATARPRSSDGVRGACICLKGTRPRAAR
jgi:hypothetical protein